MQMDFYKMKMKLGEVIKLNGTLKNIIESTSDEAPIDYLTKFKLLLVMKSIEPHVTSFEVIRNEKIAEYGKDDGNGNVGISIEDKETMQKFNNDISKLLNEEVDVKIEKIKAKDILDKGISASVLLNLLPIISEE